MTEKTNPFAAKAGAPAAQQNTAVPGAGMPGFNPFGTMDKVEDRDPLFPGGVVGKVRVNKFRVCPPVPGSQMGLCVYIDTELLSTETEVAGVRVGGKYTHRISGFNGAADRLAAAELKNFLISALADEGMTSEMHLTAGPDGGVDSGFWSRLPMQVHAEGLCEGKEVYIATTVKIGQKSGKPKVAAQFAPVL